MLEEDDFDNKYELYGLVKKNSIDDEGKFYIAIILWSFFLILFVFLTDEIKVILFFILSLPIFCFVIFSIFKLKERRIENKIKKIKHNILWRLGARHCNLVMKTFYEYKGQIKVYDIIASHKNKLILAYLEDVNFLDHDIDLLKIFYE